MNGIAERPTKVQIHFLNIGAVDVRVLRRQYPQVAQIRFIVKPVKFNESLVVIYTRFTRPKQKFSKLATLM